MGLKIGTLAADITGDTSGLRKAEKETNRITGKIDKDLKKIETTGKTAFTPAGVGAEKASAKVNTFSSRLDQIKQKFRQVREESKKTGKGLQLTGRNAGQAGIQIQQMVGQLQGGQNFFVALSQQAADLGFVLGAPLVGVIVSLAAVLGGVLFNALTGASDETGRAADSAADLSKEYLKLTKQTETLAAVNFAAAQLEDAKAMIAVRKELKQLIKDRDEAQELQKTKGGISFDLLNLPFIEAAIVEAENKLGNFESLQKERSDRLRKFFAEGLQGKGLEEPGFTAAPEGLGDTFQESLRKDAQANDLRSKLFGDTNAAIEAEITRFEIAALGLFEAGSDDFLAVEKALADKRVELRDAADKKILDNSNRSADKMARMAQQNQARALTGMLTLADQLNAALLASGQEGTAIAKAVFLAGKAIQVVQILAATEVAAANAAAVAAIGGPVPFFATAAAIRATGIASAGIVAGLGVAEAFEQGGIVGGSSFTGDNVIARVNSGEMILNGAQQAKLFSAANSGSMTGSSAGGTPNVTVINNGTPQQVDRVSVTQGQLEIAMSDAVSKGANQAVSRVNNSLSTGRGSTSKAFRQGFKANRNVR